ncbi:sphingolipid homeostasis protein orm1 [Thecaphora frezii]
MASPPPSLHLTPPPPPTASSSSINAHAHAQAPSPSSSFASSQPGAPPPTTHRPAHGRPRSGSLVSVERVEETPEELLDQAAGFNANADWVNYKGAWAIHVVLILVAKILLDSIPAMHQHTSWTLVNLGYLALSYLMFHYVTGTPFESNAGAYDQLTLWEQIDEGAQYTPAKKWLTSVPIGLFLASTHYTRYNPWLFGLNFSALFPRTPPDQLGTFRH